MSHFDPVNFRGHFEFFQQNPDWVYLDNAATMHKPTAVLNAITRFYQRNNSNVHRGAHTLSQNATRAFEQARDDIAAFINAKDRQQIIFCSGATAALNQIAFGLMHTVLQPGDRILITALEHHANIVPWQLHCAGFGVTLDIVPLTADNKIDQQAFTRLLALQPKVVSFSHISNVLGHIQPIAQMIQQAKKAGAITVVDGAQGIVHDRIDVQLLDVDFYVWSGHKLYGPTGIGVLYGKTELLEQLKPIFGGGEMISEVQFSHSLFNKLPFRLEAGTPDISGAIGLAAAINWLQKFNTNEIKNYKTMLLKQFYNGLQAIPGLDILSSPVHNAGIVALNVQGEHPADVAELLNQQHVAVRGGQHCAMPFFSQLGLAGAVRFSFAPYNTEVEVATSLQALAQAVEILTA
ncbi:cysteine sulfinate desulfinase [Arsukibacterium sp. MJ3]|uniref:aminotransferase class V-fold PLP-dependent enzyme n=1 Tax=Arsukibacterium sp. MJ3 TaxID=1632859 RepID=UPI0006273749|nr:cysteine desulfurase [Arsukibacterium sp. MJ3]KKO49160.1 cysteine sulfinate desulfinase [Arsukibacterium sp. MJ3]